MSVFLYIVFLVSPIFIIFGLLLLIRKLVTKKARLPFKIEDSTRTPAFTLIQKHKDHLVDVIAYGLVAIIYFQMPFSLYALATFFQPSNPQISFIVPALIFWIAVLISCRKSISAYRQLLITRLGIEAEWAVSASLSKIPEKNFRVFHDVQGAGFNIDHVYTWSGGVVAVETKGRRKPNLDSKDNTHKLMVSGDTIKFPHHTDTKIIEQAKRQASWLSKELSSSTGENVEVSPLVVIPGWYVERNQRPTVPVMNHKTLIKNYGVCKSRTFQDSELMRINHQLERLTLRGTK